MRVVAEDDARSQIAARGKTTGDVRTRALVVEDDAAMRALLTDVLGAADIEAVTLVKSGEAEASIQKEKFDVVLVAAGTRFEDGANLVRKIRASGFNRKTPVILISDDQRPSALTEGFRAGANFFVYKPIDKAHLMRLLRVTQGSIEHEKRRFRRVAVQAKIQVRCGDKTVDGVTVDVSLNGVLVRAPSAFPLESAVEFSLFLLPGTQPVAGTGSVVRLVDNHQMGIQFDSLPIGTIERLQDYLLPLIAV